MLLWPPLKTSVRVTMLPALMNQRASGSEAPAGRPTFRFFATAWSSSPSTFPPGAGLIQEELLLQPEAGFCLWPRRAMTGAAGDVGARTKTLEL